MDRIIEVLLWLWGLLTGGESRDEVEGSAADPVAACGITPDLLHALGVTADRAAIWARPLNDAADEYGITSNGRRLSAWLATILHESMLLSRMAENLNYSAEGLAATWPNRFRGADGKPNEKARFLHRQPEKIANEVYANRLGNGGPESGDGWRYRGRCPLQITGKANYAATSQEIDVDVVTNPDLLMEAGIGSLAAAEWWHRHGCNEPADAGDMVGVTRIVNGGQIGIENRTDLYRHCLALLYLEV